MSDEVHIAGLIVQATPARLAAVRSQILRLPGAQVHAEAADGRLIVTLETGSTKRTLDDMDALRILPGVSNVALVYQHVEDAAAMQEEVE